VLLARIAGALAAPMQQMAGLLQALPKNLAYGLSALIDQREAGGEKLPEAAPEAADSTDEAPAAPDAEAPAATDEAPVAPTDEAPTDEAPAEPVADEAPEAAGPEEAVAEATPVEAAAAEAPAADAAE
jgi:hypothetical protein